MRCSIRLVKPAREQVGAVMAVRAVSRPAGQQAGSYMTDLCTPCETNPPLVAPEKIARINLGSNIP